MHLNIKHSYFFTGEDQKPNSIISISDNINRNNLSTVGIPNRGNMNNLFTNPEKMNLCEISNNITERTEQSRFMNI